MWMEVVKKIGGTGPPTKLTLLATRYQTGEGSFISFMWRLLLRTVCGDALQHIGRHYDLHNLYGWSQVRSILWRVNLYPVGTNPGGRPFSAWNSRPHSLEVWFNLIEIYHLVQVRYFYLKRIHHCGRVNLWQQSRMVPLSGRLVRFRVDPWKN